MDLFCFASRNEENIWRGVRARKWAVATVLDSAMKGCSHQTCATSPGHRGGGFATGTAPRGRPRL